MGSVLRLLAATRQLEEKVAALKAPRQRTLKVALNTTLPAEFNRRMIDRLIAVFPQYQLEFSYAESMENLSKLKNEHFDLAILIGQQSGFTSIPMPDVQVRVVGAHCGEEDDSLGLLGDRFQVRPAEECPYSRSFLRFLDAGLGEYGPSQRMIYSCSETLTLSLITQLDGLGLVSRDAALRNGEVERSWRIGIGAPGSPTPTGATAPLMRTSTGRTRRWRAASRRLGSRTSIRLNAHPRRHLRCS